MTAELRYFDALADLRSLVDDASGDLGCAQVVSALAATGKLPLLKGDVSDNARVQTLTYAMEKVSDYVKRARKQLEHAQRRIEGLEAKHDDGSKANPPRPYREGEAGTIGGGLSFGAAPDRRGRECD